MSIFLSLLQGLVELALCSILLLLALYTAFVQHMRGPDWAAWKLFGVPGWLLDWVLNHSLFPLLLGYWPTSKEVTFSEVIANRQLEPTMRGEVFRQLKRLLNLIDPSHSHIP